MGAKRLKYDHQLQKKLADKQQLSKISIRDSFITTHGVVSRNLCYFNKMIRLE